MDRISGRVQTKPGEIPGLSTFFYSDFTAGPGVSPDRARALVGYTTDRELAQRAAPCPEGSIRLSL